MAAEDAMEVANEEGFQRRVKHFMQKAALAVMAEAGSTAFHTERVAFAKSVLDGTASVYEYAVGVVTNSTVASNGLATTDGDLEFTVNSMFTAFSGGAQASA